MKKHLLLLLFVALSFSMNSQNCFWAKSAGSNGNETGQQLVTDNLGNVIVLGTFESTSITFGSTTLTNSIGTEQMFLVKYDPAGTILWAKTAAGIAKGFGVSTDAAGNIYVSGFMDGASTTFDTITFTNTGGGDAFFAKYTSAGDVIWAKKIAGTASDEGRNIEADASGNVYITGNYYSDTLLIGSSVLVHHNSSGPDMFIAKYDAAGTPVWAKSIGGNRYDIPRGLAIDAADNIYVTGGIQSDTISFGATTLYSDAFGATNMFLTKLDPSGNITWARGVNCLWGDAIAYDLKISAANELYVCGDFQGVSIKFGNDSLLNFSSGSTDMFLAKYDLNGNALWGRRAGGNNYDYSRSLAIDNNGNAYLTGNFTSSSCTIGSDTTLLNSSVTYSSDAFISKFSTSGTFLSATKIATSGIEWIRGIDCSGTNVYFTGQFNTPLSFANTTLTSAGYSDMFVADMFNFTSGITSYSNVSCYGGNDGSAATTISGGNAPYTYTWSTSPVQTSANASNLTAGTYSVTIAEGYGCAQVSTVTITEPEPDSAAICMVTVDSLSDHNIIVWDKTSFVNVDSFTVYREISTGNYQPLATIAFDSLSQYADTARFMYFPNTGDPNAGTYRYKIQAKTLCGMSGPVSPFHNTIYIMNNSGTFYWTQLYTIEGGSNPVSNYVLMRDDSTTGNWHAISSVAGTQQTVSDPLYAVYQNTASWRVETQWNITCTATREFSTSISNTYSNVHVSVPENEFEKTLSVYPNPSNGLITVKYNLRSSNDIHFEVYNVLSEKVYDGVSNSLTEKHLDLTGFSKGFYTLIIKNSTGQYIRKLIIE